MQLKWIMQAPPLAVIEELMNALGCRQIIATLLANRGMTTPQEARAFIHPSLQDLRPPEGLKDIDRAVERLYRAIANNEKIWIFGDYDVDGVTATAILYEFLSRVGADVSCYIPHRVKEGYGLQPFHIAALARPLGINLIITTDCGSSSHEAVAAARQAGIDTIITDHHEFSGPMPKASAIINPKRPDCKAGFDSLSGVGVTFYLLVALRKFLREQKFWAPNAEPNLKVMCDLVALGTVADMVPLNAENRIMTRHGLDLIKTGTRPGLEALITVSGVQKETLDTDDLAFRLAPRLNAAGRMDHADQALALLTADTLAAARPIAQRLNELNAARQKNEKELLEQIRSHVASNALLLSHRALVLAQPDWHPGILGIVASRLTQMYHRPAVLIALDGDLGSGSARSLPGLNLHAALTSCSRELIGFGGHAMAAGLRIRTDRVAAFRQAFEGAVTAMTAGVDLAPTLAIDYELDFREIDADLIDTIAALQPFGVASPKPLFMARDVQVVSSRIVATQHRRMVLSQNASSPEHKFNAIQFNIDPSQPLPERFGRIAFELQWNYWNGNRTAQLLIAAVQADH